MSNAGHGHGHGHGGEGASPESVAAGYEVEDLKGRPAMVLTVATVGLLVMAFVVMGAMLFLMSGGLGDVANTLEPTSEIRLPPEPRLEQNPNVDGERIVADAVARLEGYGWEDQGAGTAHIPIERAKELLLAQGISPFGQAEAGAGATAAPTEAAATTATAAPTAASTAAATTEATTAAAPTTAATTAPTTAPATGGADFDAALAAQGEQLFTNLGCAGCHRDDGVGVGPSLVGIYNQPRTTSAGEVIADETYLIESILNSTAKIVDGYQPVMPAYAGQLDDDEVAQLVEYIKSLAE